MFLLLYCLMKRHRCKSSAAGRNDTTPSRRKLRCRATSLLLMLAMVLLLLLVALSYKSKDIQRHASSSIQPHISWNRNYQSKTEQHQALNGPASNYSDNFIESVNALVATNISSVDYMACCGAGHRISKMADAYYLAQRLKFTLRGFWGYCDTTASTGYFTEVFHHLFGPQTIPRSNDVFRNQGVVTIQNHYARINNDVPGFHKLIRDGQQCHTQHVDKARSDFEFYVNLRDRFRLHQSVVKDYYHTHILRGMLPFNRTVVGIHIRAGNGEKGDFSIRGRNINNVDAWLKNLTALILMQSRHQKWTNAVLFVATDTPSLVARLQSFLLQMKRNNEPAIEVTHRHQVRPTQGSGVLFGQQGNIEQTGTDCLRGWEDTIADMLLLSYVDILIAARPSSFIQGLPMSLVLGRDASSRQTTNSYCEVNPNATTIQCFHNFTDWICRGSTSFALRGIQRYEYLRIPGKLFESEINSDDPHLQKDLKIRERPETGCIPLPAGSKQVCLPYDWSNFDVKPRPVHLEESYIA